MSKRVLNVGQCNPDHASLSRFLTSHFDVEIDRSHQMDDTIEALRATQYDLVMINRKLDADYTDGIEIMRAMKNDETLQSIPVMIVSNYPETQEASVAEGAVPGFGKAQLDNESSIEKICAVLGKDARVSMGR